MRVSIEGLSQELADGIAEVLGGGGHERGEPAELAIVGVDPGVGSDLVDLRQEDWNAAVEAARASFFALQRAARVMVEHGLAGRIVVVVPVHALRTSRGCGLAAVAGSFLTTAAQVAAVELGPKGIRVNVLAVGPPEGARPPVSPMRFRSRGSRAWMTSAQRAGCWPHPTPSTSPAP